MKKSVLKRFLKLEKNIFDSFLYFFRQQPITALFSLQKHPVGVHSTS